MRVRAMLTVLAGCLVGMGCAGSVARAQEAPLDPLSATEIETTFQVLEASGRVPHGAFFPIVSLNEPPKSEVLAWSPGRPFRRQAFAQVYDRPANRLYEAVVDLRAKRLLSFVERPGAQPAVF